MNEQLILKHITIIPIDEKFHITQNWWLIQNPLVKAMWILKLDILSWEGWDRAASCCHRKWRRWLLLAKAPAGLSPLLPIVGENRRALPIVPHCSTPTPPRLQLQTPLQPPGERHILTAASLTPRPQFKKQKQKNPREMHYSILGINVYYFNAFLAGLWMICSLNSSWTQQNILYLNKYFFLAVFQIWPGFPCVDGRSHVW